MACVCRRALTTPARPPTAQPPTPHLSLLQEEEALVLVDALLERDALALLVHRLAAFDEGVAEEAAAVNNLLGIFENLVEVKPEVAELVVQKTKVCVQGGGVAVR